MPIIIIIICHCPAVRPPPPDFRRRLPPLLIIKCPPLGSVLVSIDSDAVGTDVGGGIILENVIGVAHPIWDGLRCHSQESAPPTVVDDVGSYAPHPLFGICAVFDHCITFVVIVVVVVNVRVHLMPPPLPPQLSLLCYAPGGDTQKTMHSLSSLTCSRRMNSQHQKKAWYCIDYGKITVRKCNWGNSTSFPAVLGQWRLGLTGRVHRGDESKSRSLCSKNAAFLAAGST